MSFKIVEHRDGSFHGQNIDTNETTPVVKWYSALKHEIRMRFGVELPETDRLDFDDCGRGERCALFNV